VIISQPDEPFIDVDDAAEYIKLGKSSIYKKIMNSTIPFHKKPGSNRVLFKRSELAEWLKTNDKEEK
jgi:excisionase family DNA binding protein